MGLNLDNLGRVKNNTKKLEISKKSFSNLNLRNKISKQNIELFKNFGNKQKERFFSETGMLLSAGVDLQTVLELLSEAPNQKNKFTNIYKRILDQIILGMGVSEAMESTRQFNSFDCFSVLIGENIGELSHVFSKLSNFYNKRVIQRMDLVAPQS